MDVPRVKTIFLSIVILTSLFAFVTPFQNSFESQYTTSISAGSPVVTFRDITDTSATAGPIISLNQSSYFVGDTASLKITDTNADVNTGFNIGEEDSISAVVTMSSSTTVTLTEIAADVFEGTFTVDAAPSVDYTPDSPEAARAQITLPVNPGGDVILSDVTFTESELVNLGIKPVTGAFNITLSGGASFTSVPTVEMSFANANLDGGSVLDIEMWHKAPGQNWEQITVSCNFLLSLFPPQACPFFDNGAQTITSDPSGGGFSGTDGQGEYVLAFDTGVPGGGGGGLVRPGLVVNVLAGISIFSTITEAFGGGGLGPSPPTVLSSSLTVESEDSLEGFGGIILTKEDEKDEKDEKKEEKAEDSKDDKEDEENSLDETRIVNTDEKLVFSFEMYENQGINNLEHVALFVNIRDDESITDSDTFIIFEKNKPLTITDPHDFFSEVYFELSQTNAHNLILKYEITFANPMDTSHIVLQSWDLDRWLSVKEFPNALKVVSPASEMTEIAEDSLAENTVTEFEPESQHIPIWVRNNANWWSEGQIDDSDFVAGMQYLIDKKIMKIPETQVASDSSGETFMPDWIKNNAGWWSEGLITDDDFVKGMQWLVANGIMRV